MKKFKGISASPGIAISRIYLHLDENYKIPKYAIAPEEIEGELERFNRATERAAEEISQIQEKAGEKDLVEESRFLDSHVLMLSDPEFFSSIKKNLENYMLNVEWILFITVNDVISTLESSNNPYLAERSVDIRDVARRIFGHLQFKQRISLSDLEMDVVIVTHDLLPSDTVGMKREFVKGIAMNAGGKTSHTAILARAFQIPAVLGLSNITEYAKSGDKIIVDGNKGMVILDPDKKTLKEYRKILNEWNKHEIEINDQNKLPCVTKDGKKIGLYSNIEIPEEIEAVISHQADGVGLYRSEFLFLQSGGKPGEEEQFEAYSSVLKAMNGNGSVTIRTLDVGGDKIIPEIEAIGEKNPILGWRSVRFCMGNIDIFKTQLRALLRASVYGNLKIMFPMISGVDELNGILSILKEVKEELKGLGLPFREDIPVGIMIEVPSAAVTSDLLASRVDFFSIGTNDLIQYTVAVDRGNEKVAYLYEPYHPGVLRLIKTVIDNATNEGIPVSLCGELASDPMAAILLIGMGMENLSMSSISIPEVKKAVRRIAVSDARKLAEAVLKIGSVSNVRKYIMEWKEDKFGN